MTNFEKFPIINIVEYPIYNGVTAVVDIFENQGYKILVNRDAWQCAFTVGETTLTALQVKGAQWDIMSPCFKNKHLQVRNESVDNIVAVVGNQHDIKGVIDNYHLYTSDLLEFIFYINKLITSKLTWLIIRPLSGVKMVE